MSAIGLMVLAAGASTRMGTPKQRLRFRGRSLLLPEGAIDLDTPAQYQQLLGGN